MCNLSHDNAQMVDEVIVKWTQQGRAFTSYEVTKEFQARLKEENLPFVRHAEMRDYYDESPALRDVQQNGSYTRTLRSMPHSISAFVYHPVGYDVSQYQPLDRQTGAQMPAQVPHSNLATPASPVTQSAVNTISQPKSNGRTKPASGPDVAIANKSGEVWVSVMHVQQAGFHVGDHVEFSQLSGVVTIEPASGGTKQKRVEKYGNLRLSPADRNDLGLPQTTTSFKVEVEPRKLILTSL